MKKLLILCLLFLSSTSFAYTQNELYSANKLASEGIIAEQSDAQDYRLSDTITRKEFMKVIARVTKDTIEESCENAFNDVENDWGCKYIEWALRKQFIALNPNFRPDANITKAEAMKLILKARGIERVETSNDWRENDMLTANTNGIIEYMYYDFDTQATRGWIFEVTATQKDTYTPGKVKPKYDPHLVP